MCASYARGPASLPLAGFYRRVTSNSVASGVCPTSRVVSPVVFRHQLVDLLQQLILGGVGILHAAHEAVDGRRDDAGVAD